MKIRLTILLSIILAISLSCSKVVETPVEDIIDISVSGSTKVHLNGLKTCWDKGDKLTVFYRSYDAEKWVFKGNTGDVSGQISHETVSRTETRNDIHVLYPYDPDASLEGDVLNTYIPTQQKYRSGTYGTALLAGKTDHFMLTLKYCTAIVELRYRGPAEISHIVLNGNDSEKLSGGCSISFDKDKPLLTCQGTLSVTLDCDISVVDDSTESFYFSIAPETFKKGLSFTIHFKQGGTQKVMVSEKVSVEAGHIYTVEAGTPEIHSEQKVIELLFSDGTQRHYPFTTDMTFNYGTEQGPFYFQYGDEKYPFYMLCQNDTGDKNFRVTNGGGLYIGGTDGDYIKFPAIKGYRLQNIGVSIHKSVSNFHIVPTATPGQTVTGGRCINPEAGDFRMLYLSDTKENTSYSMMLDNVCCFRCISLYYRK